MDKNTQYLFDELHDILDGYSDINAHGGPNRAMAGLSVLDELRSRYEAMLQAAQATEEHFDREMQRGGL